MNNIAITICASAAFFKQVVEIKKELKKLGFDVKIPKTAGLMKKNKDFDVSHYKTWVKDTRDYYKKAALIRGHNKKIVESDAVLMINLDKNNIKGYIGGNGLMEMGLAFHFQKTIFIYNPIDDKIFFKEEIYAMQPVFINRDLKKIVKHYND
jgi:hypothetical protein